ncbi:hypothetical protein HZH68_000471 [Vespula germanica]|uniref:Replication protein A 14 kDa subunit n=1 Tax=Vespula germanica TaxID=30212 RepID=A0A834NTN9_VESGE|nr:hypothetical protein HZH68_000471 [Vespula germanica]
MAKKRINGRYLGQNIGEEAILLGTINRKSSNGKNIELLTTDGVQVNVTLNEALDINAEGYIEIHGTVQSKGTMSCNSFILFPTSMTAKFQTNQYNDLLTVLNVLGTKKWMVSESDCGY